MNRIQTKSLIATSAANAAAVVTIPSLGLSDRWRVLKLTATYSDGAGDAEGGVTIADATGTVWDVHTPSGGGVAEDFTGAGGLSCAPGPVTITLAAGGAGIVGKLNVMFCREQ